MNENTCPTCRSYQHGTCIKRFPDKKEYFMTDKNCPYWIYWAEVGEKLLSTDENFEEVEKLKKRMERE